MRGGKDVFYSFFFLKHLSDRVWILEMLKCFKTCGIIDCYQGKKLTSMIIIVYQFITILAIVIIIVVLVTYSCLYLLTGPLLKHIEKKKVFTEREAALVVKDIVTALDFLHKKGA